MWSDTFVAHTSHRAIYGGPFFHIYFNGQQMPDKCCKRCLSICFYFFRQKKIQMVFITRCSLLGNCTLINILFAESRAMWLNRVFCVCVCVYALGWMVSLDEFNLIHFTQLKHSKHRKMNWFFNFVVYLCRRRTQTMMTLFRLNNSSFEIEKLMQHNVRYMFVVSKMVVGGINFQDDKKAATTQTHNAYINNFTFIHDLNVFFFSKNETKLWVRITP